ncbi:MAG: toprim domain-containing protein, partial [Thermoplasmata archaeon]|nr:toprim domain-containing protein [Thermoplasmata archaeon]
ILGAALETIDRVGPCRADIKVASIEDTRVKKRNFIVDRAKDLLGKMLTDNKEVGVGILDSVRQCMQEEEITSFGSAKLPAGPNIETSDSIILVEGRSDVLNLLKFGIKNTVAVEGTSVPESVTELSKKRTVIAFVDGDRGGELILKELLQVAEVDFIARAPRAHEVEELTQKQIVKALRNKIPAEQFIEMYSLDNGKKGPGPGREKRTARQRDQKDDRKGQKKDDRPQNKPKKEEKKLSPELEVYRKKLKEIAGSHEAVLLDEEGKVVTKTPINAMFPAISDNKGKFTAVVMDGIVTQKLLDTVSLIDVKAVVGIKTGNVTKKPESVKIWTKEELW